MIEHHLVLRNANLLATSILVRAELTHGLIDKLFVLSVQGTATNARVASIFAVAAKWKYTVHTKNQMSWFAQRRFSCE